MAFPGVGDHLHVGLIIDEALQPLADQRVIVYKQYAEFILISHQSNR